MSSAAFDAASVPLGSVATIPIRLHVTFPLFLLLNLLSQGFTSWAAVLWALALYGGVLLLTVLVHELGHSLATIKLGGQAHGILLWPLGGLAFVGHSSGPKADLLIAVAGPATHVPMLLLWLAALFPTYHAAYGTWAIRLSVPDPTAHFWLALVAGAVQLNIALMAFNLLLPAYPLDGGRVLADALLLSGMEPDRAAKITVGVAAVLGTGVAGFGIWQQAVLTTMVGVWMLYTTYQLYVFVRDGRVEQHPMFSYSAEASLPGSVGSKEPYQRWGDDF